MTELTRRERKKEATRNNIMETAVRLFNQQGFEQTTMNQISEEADVALGTLYNYFTSKEAIIGYYMQVVMEQYHEENWSLVMEKPTTYERVASVLKLSADWMEKNKVLTEIYISDPRNYYFGPNWQAIPKNGFDEVFAEIFEKGQQQGDITKEFSPKVLARQMIGMYYISVISWFANPLGGSLEQRFTEGLDLFFKGCKN